MQTESRRAIGSARIGYSRFDSDNHKVIICYHEPLMLCTRPDLYIIGIKLSHAVALEASR